MCFKQENLLFLTHLFMASTNTYVEGSGNLEPNKDFISKFNHV